MPSYPSRAMDTVIGLVELVVYIVAILALSMALTWLVIKISPSGEREASRAEAREGQRPARRRSGERATASASGVYGRPWASATASYVSFPPSMLTPFASAGSSAIAPESPLPAIAST